MKYSYYKNTIANVAIRNARAAMCYREMRDRAVQDWDKPRTNAQKLKTAERVAEYNKTVKMYEDRVVRASKITMNKEMW